MWPHFGGRPKLTFPVRLFWGEDLEDIDTPTTMGRFKDYIPRDADFFTDAKGKVSVRTVPFQKHMESWRRRLV